MKKLLLAVSLVVPLLLAGCAKPIPTRTPAPSGKDAIVAFDSQVAPLGQRYEQLVGEWNIWMEKMTRQEFERDFLGKVRYMDSELSQLHDRLVKLEAPQECVRFKGFLASAIVKSIEYFALIKQYYASKNEVYRIRADSAAMDGKTLYSQAADEWDAIKARYGFR